MEFDFGYNYKVHDAALAEKIEKVFADNKDKITVIQPETETESSYYPIKPLLHLMVHWMILDNVSIVTYLDPDTGRALFSIYETTNQDELIKEMRIRLRDCADKISSNYTNVLVQSNFYEAEDYFGETHVIYQRMIGKLMNPVVRLCKGMTSMYCKKEGLPVPEGCTEAIMNFPETLTELLLEDEENG